MHRCCRDLLVSTHCRGPTTLPDGNPLPCEQNEDRAVQKTCRNSEFETHDLSVALSAQVLIGLVVDGVDDELHAAVAKQELRTAGMRGYESNLRIPIAWPVAGIGCCHVTGVEVDRDQGRAIAVAVIGRRPSILDVF